MGAYPNAIDTSVPSVRFAQNVRTPPLSAMVNPPTGKVAGSTFNGNIA
jgi:hypothetical protein